jgi:hypothetical protein
VSIAGVAAPVYASDLRASAALAARPAVAGPGPSARRDLGVASCTSREGARVSLGSGSGAQHARLWPARDSLGYDSEPACSEVERAAP